MTLSRLSGTDSLKEGPPEVWGGAGPACALTAAAAAAAATTAPAEGGPAGLACREEEEKGGRSERKRHLQIYPSDGQ